MSFNCLSIQKSNIFRDEDIIRVLRNKLSTTTKSTTVESSDSDSESSEEEIEVKTKSIKPLPPNNKIPTSNTQNTMIPSNNSTASLSNNQTDVKSLWKYFNNKNDQTKNINDNKYINNDDNDDDLTYKPKPSNVVVSKYNELNSQRKKKRRRKSTSIPIIDNIKLILNQ